MYSLLEYSDNFSMTSWSLWNCYRDEINDSDIETDNDANKLNNGKIIPSKSFEFKTRIIRSTPNYNNTLNAELFIPLRFPDLSLINFETKLDLSWSKEWIISEISTTPEVRRDNPVDAIQTNGPISQIHNANLYISVVTLPINDNIKFLENIKQGFKRPITWNKYLKEQQKQNTI